MIINIQIIRIEELTYLLGISKSTLWRWRKDPSVNFPSAIMLGSRVVGWRLIEIDTWLNSNKCEGYAA